MKERSEVDVLNNDLGDFGRSEPNLNGLLRLKFTDTMKLPADYSNLDVPS